MVYGMVWYDNVIVNQINIKAASYMSVLLMFQTSKFQNSDFRGNFIASTF